MFRTFSSKLHIIKYDFVNSKMEEKTLNGTSIRTLSIVDSRASNRGLSMYFDSKSTSMFEAFSLFI